MPTDLTGIRCLSYAANGSLYAAATKDDEEGIYRLDVALDNGRQVIRSAEIARLPNVVAIGCSPAGDGWVLVGGQQDGRLLVVELR